MRIHDQSLLQRLLNASFMNSLRVFGSSKNTPVNALHLHAQVLGFDDDRHAAGLKRFLNAVADLFRQPLLHLQPPCKRVHHPWNLAQPHDVPVRNVSHVRLPKKREHVVLAKRIQFNVADANHLVTRLLKQGSGIPAVSTAMAFAARCGVFTKPSRSTSSPMRLSS
jgi:hypothetical protein